MNLYFICPDTNTAAGGIKQIYRQVDVLNEAGYNAYVLHESPFFKCTWFNNKTKIMHSQKVFHEIRACHKNFKGHTSIKKRIKKLKTKLERQIENIGGTKTEKLEVKPGDIFVFPEVYAFAASKVYPNNRKVIYNQNCYYTFTNLSLKEHIPLPYTDSHTMATIVASIDAINYLDYAYPNLNIHRLHYGIDSTVFNYEGNKKKKIAYMPRKLHEDVLQVISIIKERGLLKEWEFIEIDNMNEDEVAETFKESAIFLSFNHREGFGMPPAEAMACGCVVIGYTGLGGKEYFKEDFSYAIPDRDVQAFAKKVERVIQDYSIDEKAFIDKGKMASDFILSEYTLTVEKNDIIDVWYKILN